MLHVSIGGSFTDLAGELASVLSTPLSDPMQVEWIGVPTQGVSAWLEIELARHLGAQQGRSDGVAANLDLRFSGDLRRRLRRALDGDIGAEDPWHLDRLVWTVVDVLAEASDDCSSPLAPVAQLPDGATLYGQARSLADLIDHYISNRPAMLGRWADGESVDGAGSQIPAAAAWQPELFRAVRARIARPSPAERIDAVLEMVRTSPESVDLPERFSLFGFTSLPGGQTLLRELEALAQRREVYLFLWQPSPGLGRWALEHAAQHPPDSNEFGLVRPTTDPFGSAIHPLVRSWAKPSREAAVLLADVATRGAQLTVVPSSKPSGVSLLAQLQERLRGGEPARDAFLLDPGAADDSLIVLPCHGQIRQVEVLRDEILRALDDDPSLKESDIVVLCPTLPDYVPLIEAVFGQPAAEQTIFEPRVAAEGAPVGAPALSYQITDRSLTRLNPILGALASLLDMLSDRFTASVVTDFLRLAPVGARYGFSDDEFGTIVAWVEELGVRWGLDAPSRARWIGEKDYTPGTWAAALDRLLLGVASSDADDRLSVGDVLPFGVEGTDIELVGRLAEFFARLAALADEVRVPRPPRAWTELLREAVEDFFDVPIAQSWMVSSVVAKLSDIADRAEVAARVNLTLSDIRRLLADEAAPTASPTRFFRGGITVTSLSPLRGVPFRVVCILGFDDEGLRAGGTDGDDLLTLSPMIGDRDRRADLRQSLLEAVMSAGDRLIITRTGQSRVTNNPVPMTAALAELRDALVDGATFPNADAVELSIERATTCNSFDPRNFRGERRSYDPVACAGAAVACGEPIPPAPFLSAPLHAGDLTVVELADVHRMLRSPPRFFLTRRLEVQLDDGAGSSSDDEIPIELDGLTRWELGERLVAAFRSGRSVDEFRRIEEARGTLPPGVFGDEAMDSVKDTATQVLGLADSLGVLHAPVEPVAIEATLPSGIRLVGYVNVVSSSSHRGPVTLGVGKLKPKRILAAWLDLMALAATDPTRQWEALLIGAPTSRSANAAATGERLGLPDDPEDADGTVGPLDALDVVIDLYRRASSEPLPIFPETSPALHYDKRGEKAWSTAGPGGGSAYGDRHDPATQLAFGDLEFEELCALPPLQSDGTILVNGERSRVQLYANLLWGTVDRSCVRNEIATGEVADRG